LEKAGLESDYREQEIALHNRYAEREQESAQQLQARQYEIHELQRTSIQREQELADKLLAATQQFANVEAQLQGQIHLERHSSILLRQALVTVQQRLEATQDALSWRLTAPFRALASWVFPDKDVLPITIAYGDANAMQLMVSGNPDVPVHNLAIAPGNPPPASTLGELLAYDGEQFIENAYRALLGRAADPEGLTHYLGRLHACMEFYKSLILAQLCLSKEGRGRGAEGYLALGPIIKLFKKRKRPLLGWLSRMRNTFPSGLVIDKLSGHAVDPGTSETTLGELLALDGRPFIECAYQTLLARAPDPDGLAYYQRRLDAHVEFCKGQILAQLCLSKEGRTRGAGGLPGLRPIVRFFKERKYPVVGWLFRLRNTLPVGPAYYVPLGQVFHARSDQADNSLALPMAVPCIAEPASSFQELLAYSGQQFIGCAYRTLLERDPDPDGGVYYLRRLLAGVPKIQIIAQICRSPEARAKAVKLRGLRKALRIYRLGRLPMVGILVDFFVGVESGSISDTRLRAIEQLIFASTQGAGTCLGAAGRSLDAQAFHLGQHAAERFEHIEQGILDVQRLIAEIAEKDAHRASPKFVPTSAAAPGGHRRLPASISAQPIVLDAPWPEEVIAQFATQVNQSLQSRQLSFRLN
jgi:hypothetical protein